MLPGVTVTGTNVDTGVGTTAVTNADGIYLLPFLPPGSTRVTAELMGFKKLVREGIAVRIGDRLTLDLALEVGAARGGGLGDGGEPAARRRCRRRRAR